MNIFGYEKFRVRRLSNPYFRAGKRFTNTLKSTKKLHNIFKSIKDGLMRKSVNLEQKKWSMLGQ